MWVAPCPVLLPLRPAALVAEEIAWLAARHPGRVGLGVAAGALALDFDVMDLDLGDAVTRFKADLPRVVAMLRGEDLGELDGDPALQRCAAAPVTVLSAAVSPAAGRRAASVGAGILLESMSTPERQRAVCDAFRGRRWHWSARRDPAGVAGRAACGRNRRAAGRLRELFARHRASALGRDQHLGRG